MFYFTTRFTANNVIAWIIVTIWTKFRLFIIDSYEQK
jgi:hypothetical protein